MEDEIEKSFRLCGEALDRVRDTFTRGFATIGLLKALCESSKKTSHPAPPWLELKLEQAINQLDMEVGKLLGSTEPISEPHH